MIAGDTQHYAGFVDTGCLSVSRGARAFQTFIAAAIDIAGLTAFAFMLDIAGLAGEVAIILTSLAVGQANGIGVRRLRAGKTVIAAVLHTVVAEAGVVAKVLAVRAVALALIFGADGLTANRCFAGKARRSALGRIVIADAFFAAKVVVSVALVEALTAQTECCAAVGNRAGQTFVPAVIGVGIRYAETTTVVITRDT